MPPPATHPRFMAGIALRPLPSLPPLGSLEGRSLVSYLAQIKQRLLVYSTLFEIHLRCIADFLDHPFKHCALSLHLVSAFIPTSDGQDRVNSEYDDQ